MILLPMNWHKWAIFLFLDAIAYIPSKSVWEDFVELISSKIILGKSVISIK